MNSDELKKLMEADQRHQQAVTELRIEHARFKMALEVIAAYSPGMTPIPGDPIEIARTALNRSVKP